jgi:L-ascorbate metabolism protein UlaG (beta-lactamase superfamily)
MLRHTGTLVVSFFLITGSIDAAPQKPVAVRFWGQGLVTVETYWNLRVAIDPYSPRIGYDDPKLEADLVLVTHDHFDHNNAGLIRGTPRVVQGLDRSGEVRRVDLVLDRPANSTSPQVAKSEEATAPSEHAVRVRSVASFHDDAKGRQRGRNAMFLIEADDVRILHCGDLGQPSLTERQLKEIGTVDVVCIPVGGVYTVDGPQAASIVEQLKPRVVVPIHYKTVQLTIDLNTREPFLEALSARYERIERGGNTVAVTAGRGPSADSPHVALLSTAPRVMPQELADLFAGKEAASRKAQALFSTLSVNQMNHRPSDGTHTPRWNAEHMMGRDLGFFSAIYSKIDPSVPALDLNPAQMPEDYTAAHPDWTGAEESRQIERATQFTRRFAYLLEGIELDETPAGSWWTLRGLLLQMERHYGEHGANVRKKFDLPDWPQE